MEPTFGWGTFVIIGTNTNKDSSSEQLHVLR